MGRIVVDIATRSKLGDLADYVEFCDETGTVLGHFIPVVTESVYNSLSVPQPDDAEMDRRMKEPARTTVDILHDLERRS